MTPLLAYLNNYKLIPPAPTCQVLGDSYGMRPAFLGRAGHDHRPSYLSSENYQPPPTQPPPKKRGRKQESSAEKRAYALELIDVLVRGDRKALLVSYATEPSWHGRLKVSEEKR
jgi:hypothetical protein